jgi:hypothetical protein
MKVLAIVALIILIGSYALMGLAVKKLYKTHLDLTKST